jgi:signal peptidase II
VKIVRHLRWVSLVFFALAVDQATKFAVERNFAPDATRVILPGWLNLVRTSNRGVAFGFFADSQSPWMAALLVGFAVLVMIFLGWMLAAGRAGGTWGRYGMAMILGGAAGNVLDRLAHGSVTDFIDVHMGVHHWPAFNVADSAIVAGAGLVLIELLRDWRHPTEERA